MRISLIIISIAGLLSGCNHFTDSGPIDDYRTNHPIIIAERQKTYDLPISSERRRLSIDQISSIKGFMRDYEKSGSKIKLIIPTASVNEVAAKHISKDILRVFDAKGIDIDKVSLYHYRPKSIYDTPPIRIAYSYLSAKAGACGRWPKDILDNDDNKHWANFGCSYQNNIASQIDNPGDLLGPRETDNVIAANRINVIKNYVSK